MEILQLSNRKLLEEFIEEAVLQLFGILKQRFIPYDGVLGTTFCVR